MNNNLSCVLCGSNIISFEIINGIKSELRRSNHKNILTWHEYKLNPKDWFLNHPTLCFRKQSLLRAGNYRQHFRVPFEDLELELRLLIKSDFHLRSFLLIQMIFSNGDLNI